jgi:iron complex outermembrane recepter protein
MIIKRKTALAAACAALGSPVLFAQQSPEAESVKTLQTVSVTVNKIEEKLKDVPQSVTLITGEEMQEKGIRNIADLVREIPNLSSTFLYANEVNFRGINSSTFTNANPVVIYVDGVPQSSRYAYDALLENIERIEVLRGPQGSLYGKDAIGGVINIVTREPGNAWAGHVGSEIANLGGKEMSLSTAGPLIRDKLFLSFSGKANEEAGWITNKQAGMNADADRQDEQRFKLGLTYKASPVTRIRLNASREKQTNHWIDGGMIPASADYNGYARSDAEHAEFDEQTVTKTVTDSQSLAIQHAFGEVKLDAITTNKSVKLKGDYDLDWGASPLYRGLSQFQHSTIDTQTQELRLSSGKADQLRWVGGLYLERERYRNSRYGMQYPGAMMGNPFGPGVDIDMDAPSTTKNTTQAVFGQIMLPLKQDLELTLGGRWQQIKKAFDGSMYMQPIGSSGYPPAISLNSEHTWNAFLPKAAFSFALSPVWKSYVSVAKGYLPGGYNYWPSSSVEADNRFGPQTSTNYEAGIRSEFGRLYLSAALFYMDIKDIHVYSFDMGTGMVSTSNAGKATSRGAELEASYWLSSEWELSSAFGLVSASYDEYPDSRVNGNKIEKTPAYNGRISLQYAGNHGFYGRGDLRAQGKRYFNPENTFSDGAYTTVDLRAGYKSGPWDVYAFVRNLTDEAYRTAVMSMSNGTLITFGEPRRFGLGARYNF